MGALFVPLVSCATLDLSRLNREMNPTDPSMTTRGVLMDCINTQEMLLFRNYRMKRKVRNVRQEFTGAEEAVFLSSGQHMNKQYRA
jgi:hypothetical protein